MGILLYTAACALLSCLPTTSAASVPALHDPSRFTSHVTVHTPARSFSHGVGDSIDTTNSRSSVRAMSRSARVLGYTSLQDHGGYPREQPPTPFYNEDISQDNSLSQSPWNYDNYIKGGSIPVLPASPYHVDSSNPESLWPEGLFIPPRLPLRGLFAANNDQYQHPTDNVASDPYLLSGSEALAALARIRQHGELFFHDIPHETSLLEDRQRRIDNGLAPHRFGSIRIAWPFYRP